MDGPHDDTYPTVVQVDDRLIVFRSGYGPGMSHHPQCVARTPSGERCGADLPFCGTIVIQILGTDAAVYARVSPLPAECFTRQRCPAHVNSSGEDAAAPAWEPFAPERHPDTLAYLVPRWSPAGIWTPPDRPWGGWVNVDHSVTCPFGDHVALAERQADMMEDGGYLDDFSHRMQAAAQRARWATLIGDHMPDLAALLGPAKARPPKEVKAKVDPAPPMPAVEPIVAEAEECQAGPTALYRYFDEADLLLYVGISDRLRSRTGSHIAGSSWMDFAVRSTIERHPTRAIALEAEEAAIHAEHPLFNHQHNDTPEARRALVEYLIKHDRLDLLAPAVSRG